MRKTVTCLLMVLRSSPQVFFYIMRELFFFYFHQRFQNPRTDHLLRDRLLQTVYDTVAARIFTLFAGALTMDTACSVLCWVPVTTVRG